MLIMGAPIPIQYRLLTSPLRRLLRRLCRIDVRKPFVAAHRAIPIALLLAIIAGVVTACSRGTRPPPSASLPPNTAAEIGTRRGWFVILAEPCADTLSYPWQEVIPAVEQTLRADHWRIQRADPGAGVILTQWKRIRHPLVRLFAGGVEARCAVNIRALNPTRTLVVFQGGLASRRDLGRSAALGLAQRAYRNASRDWRDELRAEVRRLHALHASKP
jgi:hypothetical protein